MHRGQVGRDCLQDANRRGLVVHEYASLAPRRNLAPKNHRVSFRINAVLFEEADYMLLCPAFEFKHSGYDSAFRNEPPQYGQIYGRRDGTPNRPDAANDPYASRQWGASDMANDVGYRDGVTAGQYDRGRRARADYEAIEGYREADHGYSGSYGDRGAYQLRYRTGFERGYQDGYGRSR